MGLLHTRTIGKLDIAQEYGEKDYEEKTLQRYGKFRADKYRPEPTRTKTPQYTIVCRLVIPTDETTETLLQKEKEHKGRMENRKENNRQQDNQ